MNTLVPILGALIFIGPLAAFGFYLRHVIRKADDQQAKRS